MNIYVYDLDLFDVNIQTDAYAINTQPIVNIAQCSPLRKIEKLLTGIHLKW